MTVSREGGGGILFQCMPEFFVSFHVGRRMVLHDCLTMICRRHQCDDGQPESYATGGGGPNGGPLRRRLSPANAVGRVNGHVPHASATAIRSLFYTYSWVSVVWWSSACLPGSVLAGWVGYGKIGRQLYLELVCSWSGGFRSFFVSMYNWQLRGSNAKQCHV